MGFSWWCRNRKGEDLFEKYNISARALGLSDSTCPRSTQEIRAIFYDVPYKDQLQRAAMDALNFAQSLVLENLNYYTGPAHSECPSCVCERAKPRQPFGFDIEQARRFIRIPLTDVWRGGASR